MNTTAADINTWTHPTTGQTRRYINNWADLAGFDYDTYRNGNLRWVNFGDEQLSNNKGGTAMVGKVWIDTDDVLHFDGHNEYAVVTIDQKRTNLVAALTAQGIAAS